MSALIRIASRRLTSVSGLAIAVAGTASRSAVAAARARPLAATAAASFSAAAAGSSYIQFSEADHKMADLTKDKAIVYYSATWCGPCKMIAPHFNGLADKYSSTIKFVKVDVDDNEATAAQAGVSSIPVFHIYQGGKKVRSFIGADVNNLTSAVETLNSA